MYDKPRPIVVSAGIFPNGYIAFMTKAETIEELKRDIVSNTELRNGDLAKFQFSTDSYGALTSNVPLFESSADIHNVNDPRFDTYANKEYFDTHVNDDDSPYLFVTLSESNKMYNSGAISLMEFNNTSECCRKIETEGLVPAFKEKYGFAPEMASLSQLRDFITRQSIMKTEKKREEQKGDPNVNAMNGLTKAIADLVQSNRELMAELKATKSNVNTLPYNANARQSTGYVPGDVLSVNIER